MVFYRTIIQHHKVCLSDGVLNESVGSYFTMSRLVIFWRIPQRGRACSLYLFALQQIICLVETYMYTILMNSAPGSWTDHVDSWENLVFNKFVKLLKTSKLVIKHSHYEKINYLNLLWENKTSLSFLALW